MQESQDDTQLIADVMKGLSIPWGVPYDMQENIRIKVMAVREYMINAGIDPFYISQPLGIATLTVGVSDLWNLSSGEVKFSEAFTRFLIPQLQATQYR